jgi:hypothetical protein
LRDLYKDGGVFAPDGGQGVLHLLSTAPHELPLLDEDETPTDMTPGLSLLLSYKPDTDEADVYGRTPLLHAIRTAAYSHSALKLVRTQASYPLNSNLLHYCHVMVEMSSSYLLNSNLHYCHVMIER